jgi:hypothetical protein
MRRYPNPRPHPKRYDRRSHGFRLTCAYCDADNIDSVKEAVALGWDYKRLITDFRDAPWTHLGVCPNPECKAEEDGSAPTKRERKRLILPMKPRTR